MNQNDAVLGDLVVVGLGNPVLSDDAVGILVVRELKEKYAFLFPKTSFCLNYSGGVDLLYDLIGFPRAIIIDSIMTGRADPGYCHEFTLDDLDMTIRPHLIDSHGLNLMSALEVGRKCAYLLPDEIAIFGIEGLEFGQFSEQPSAKILDNFPKIIEIIKKKIHYWSRGHQS